MTENNTYNQPSVNLKNLGLRLNIYYCGCMQQF